jgi:hypothetical protein
MHEFDPTKPINVDDLDIDEIERKFEMLSPEGVLEMAQNFGSPPPSYAFLPELKRDNFRDAEFVYNGIKYWFAGWWILGWEANGEEQTLEFDTKEEFLSAPIFDGKTIEEIADQIKYYDICLEPGAYE